MWENLKGYYYMTRKSITLKLSVVTYRVLFCKALKRFFLAKRYFLPSQIVIFKR